MNYIRLCRLLYSKRMRRELLLLVQITLMVLMAFVVLEPVDAYLINTQKLRQAFSLDFSDVYHFSQGNASFLSEMEDSETQHTDPVYDMLCALPDVDAVLRTGVCQASYEAQHVAPNQNVEIDQLFYDDVRLLVYSEKMIESTRLPLEKETDIVANGCDIRVITSGSMSEKMPVGTVQNLKIILPNGNVTLRAFICGTLKPDCAIPEIDMYGSNPTLSCLAHYPNAANGEYLIAVENECLSNLVSWRGSYLIVPKAKTEPDSFKKGLLERVGSFGTVRSLEEILKGAFDTLVAENRWHILGFILLSFVAMFGYGGYMFLMIRQRQREFSIFYMLGMTRTQMTGLIFSCGALLLVIAFSIAGCLSPLIMRSVLHSEYSNPSIFCYLFCSVSLLLILTCSVMAGFRQSRKLSEFAIYQRGD